MRSERLVEIHARLEEMRVELFDIMEELPRSPARERIDNAVSEINEAQFALQPQIGRAVVQEQDG